MMIEVKNVVEVKIGRIDVVAAAAAVAAVVVVVAAAVVINLIKIGMWTRKVEISYLNPRIIAVEDR